MIHMISGNSVINNPIIAANTDVVLGHIHGIMIDPHLSHITAFTLKPSSRETLVLPWMGVKRIEPGQLFAWAANMIIRTDELFDVRRLLQEGTIKPNMRFRSADGELLGNMHDFYFDQHSGAVIEYEIAGGPLADSETGRYVIPAQRHTTIDKEAGTAYLPLKFTALARLIQKGDDGQ